MAQATADVEHDSFIQANELVDGEGICQIFEDIEERDLFRKMFLHHEEATCGFAQNETRALMRKCPEEGLEFSAFLEGLFEETFAFEGEATAECIDIIRDDQGFADGGEEGG